MIYTAGFMTNFMPIQLLGRIDIKKCQHVTY